MQLVYVGRRYRSGIRHCYVDPENRKELMYFKGSFTKRPIIGGIYEVEQTGENTYRASNTHPVGYAEDVDEWRIADQMAAVDEWRIADQMAAVLSAKYRESRILPNDVEDAIHVLKEYRKKLRTYDEKAAFGWFLVEEMYS